MATCVTSTETKAVLVYDYADALVPMRGIAEMMVDLYRDAVPEPVELRCDPPIFAHCKTSRQVL